MVLPNWFSKLPSSHMIIDFVPFQIKQIDIAGSYNEMRVKLIDWTVKIYSCRRSLRHKAFFQSWSPIVLLSRRMKHLRSYRHLDSLSHNWYPLENNNPGYQKNIVNFISGNSLKVKWSQFPPIQRDFFLWLGQN